MDRMHVLDSFGLPRDFLATYELIVRQEISVFLTLSYSAEKYRRMASPSQIDSKGNPVTNANHQGCRKDCQDAQKGTRLIPILAKIMNLAIVFQDVLRDERDNWVKEKKNSNCHVHITFQWRMRAALVAASSVFHGVLYSFFRVLAQETA